MDKAELEFIQSRT